MEMKSVIFKSAWAIFRVENISFSQALIKAWRKSKENIKAVIVKSNKLVKNQGLGYRTVFFNELVYTSIKNESETVKYNVNIEKYYGVGTFNND